MKKCSLTLILLSSLLTLGLVSSAVSKDSGTVLLADRYGVGDLITIPKKDITYNDETKTVEGYIVTPNGDTFVGKQFTPQEAGIYKVVYKALFGNHLEKIEQEIIVSNYSTSMFVDTTNTGDIFYGNANEYGDVDSNLSGVILESRGKSNFEFNKVIDFEKITADDYFIEGLLLPKKKGSADCNRFVVTLTNVDNPSETISIKATDSTMANAGGMGMYVLSKTSSQIFGGLEGDDNYHSDGNWGTIAYSSFLGVPRSGDTLIPFRFYFDINDLALYTYPNLPYSNDCHKVYSNDFNNSKFYGANLLNGFTSSKFKLSIKMESLSGSYSRMLISNCCGIQFNNSLVEDETAPVISIQTPSSLFLPSGEVNKKFNIFEAEVYDNIFDNLDYSTYVTYYDTTNQLEIDVSSTDEYFIPTRAGIYHINYKAKDNFNNETFETVEITIHDSVQSIILDVDTTSLSFDIFSTVSITPIDEVHAYGGNGDLKLQVNVYDKDYNKVEVDNNSFKLLYVGKYYIVYNAIDYIGNAGYSTIEIDSLTLNKPKAINQIILEKAYLKDFKYTLKNYEGAEVIDGNEIRKIEPKIYVNNVLTNEFVANGNTVLIKYVYEGETGITTYEFEKNILDGNHGGAINNYFVGEDYTFDAHQSYSSISASKDFEASFVNPVLSTPFTLSFSFEKSKTNFEYFYINVTNYENENDTITFYFKRVTDYYCKVKVGIDGEYSDLLTGSGLFAFKYDSMKKVIVDSTGLELASVKKTDNNKEINPFIGAYISLGLINVSSESQINIHDLDGQTLGHGQLFECIDCEEWYNESDLVDGKCPVHTDKTLSPDLTAYNYDFVRPNVYFDGSFPGVCEVGETTILPKVKSFDVLSYIEKEKLTISYKSSSKESNYTNVLTTDINQLSSFKFDKAGVYLFEYTITDSAYLTNNKFSYRKIVNVFENDAPVLNVENSIKEAYLVNSVVNVPSYSVSDNSGYVTVEVYLYLPNDEMRLLLVDRNGEVQSLLSATDLTYPNSFKVADNDKAFRLETKGTYKLKIVAYDSYYNRTVKTFTFEAR